ncbi:MAG TPA: hypothetical protein PLI48_07610 [Gammaproteobacteria bacterium]|nr:hypothetical protein [Gammaproteobacteria bacterium]HRP87406.1 hypothetical protein [Gammaproteobacteria bacterium]
MRAGRLSVVLGAIVIATLVSGAIPDRAHAHVPEVAGLVQEWSPDLRHLVLDGVEYALSPEFEVVDQDGRVLSAFQVSVGSRVRIVEHDGVVHTVVLLPSGTGQ